MRRRGLCSGFPLSQRARTSWARAIDRGARARARGTSLASSAEKLEFEKYFVFLLEYLYGR